MLQNTIFSINCLMKGKYTQVIKWSNLIYVIPESLIALLKNKGKSATALSLRTHLDFVYVGRLVKYKNVDTVIRALNIKYRNRDYRLHIIGEGAEKERLQDLTKELSCDANVIFYGQLPREKVFEMMKKSYSFIMVSNNETFGMVYIEAMMAGCITIASKNGGVDGVIIDGENGYLSKQGDVDDLVNTLERIENEKNLSKIRKEAIKTAYGYRDSKIAENYLKEVLG